MFNFNLLKDEVFRLLGIDNLVKSFTEYVEARVALIKKEIRDELAHQISRIVVMVFMMLIGLLTIVFLSIALGFWLSELMGSSTYGFLSVGGIYLLFSLLLWLGRDRASDALAENLKRKMEQKR